MMGKRGSWRLKASMMARGIYDPVRISNNTGLRAFHIRWLSMKQRTGLGTPRPIMISLQSSSCCECLQVYVFVFCRNEFNERLLPD